MMDTGGRGNADTDASSCLNGSFSQPHSAQEVEEQEEEMSSLEDCFRHLAQEARGKLNFTIHFLNSNQKFSHNFPTLSVSLSRFATVS